MYPDLHFDPLWAVHISDGFLTEAWCLGGFFVAGLLALLGAWRLKEEEVPQVAVLTAAFFVMSAIHVPVVAGPKTHLLMNGLLGVVLGRRALLAVPVGLFLQAALLGHGGFTSLGVNSVVMGLPALLAWGLFGGLRRLPWVRRPWFRAGLVGASTLLFVFSLTYSVALLLTNRLQQVDSLDLDQANQVLLHPVTWLGAAALAALAAWVERRLENSPEFPLGLVVGETAVLATIFLNGLALLAGGEQDWHTLVLLTLITHLPLAVVEGIVLGFTVGFLVRVKPEMLGWAPAERPECTADPLP